MKPVFATKPKASPPEVKPRIRKAEAATKPTIPLACDSGAFSFYMKVAAARSADGKLIRGFKHADHDYADKQTFRRYLEAYKNFIREAGSRFEYCVSLDVIGSEKKTFDVYQEMVSEGLKVLPVYHFGEDVKYLKKYMEMTDYIGLGGLVKTGTASESKGFRDRTWKVICDAKGRPRVKVHAFGMTSFEPMLQHPYFSVDSTTTFQWSRYGCIMLPNAIRTRSEFKGFDFAKVPTIYPVTPGRSKTGKHIDHHHPDGLHREALEQYAELVGIPLETMRTSYGARDTANLYFFNRMMEAISEQQSERVGVPLKMTYYGSGNFSTTLTEFNKSLAHLAKIDQLSHLAYLGTFAQLNPTTRLCKDWYNVNLAPLQFKGKMTE